MGGAQGRSVFLMVTTSKPLDRLSSLPLDAKWNIDSPVRGRHSHSRTTSLLLSPIELLAGVRHPRVCRYGRQAALILWRLMFGLQPSAVRFLLCMPHAHQYEYLYTIAGGGRESRARCMTGVLSRNSARAMWLHRGGGSCVYLGRGW
jgi:hypothetical protein